MIKRILFILLLCSSAIPFFSQEDIAKKGQQVPDFEYITESGARQKISKLRGKVILINFFATWCGPCRMELPVLQKNVWNKYKDNKEFHLLVIGREHTTAEIKAFKEKEGLELPMVPDADKSIFTRFAEQTIPRNYIIDRNGKVVYASVGYSPNEFQHMTNVLDRAMSNTLPDLAEVKKYIPFKFDQKFYECENKWVVFQSYNETGEYPCGVVYLDATAGFTVDVQGIIKVEKQKMVFVPQSNIQTIKIRLKETTNLCSILDDKWLTEWNLKKEPEWLQLYKIKDPIKHDIIFGEKLNAINECQAALPILEKVYKTSPQAEGLESELAYAYNALKEYEKAIEVLNDALKHQPDNILLYKELGYAYFSKGVNEKAIQLYTLTIEKCTDAQRDIKREIANNLAAIYQKMNDKASMKKWLDKANEWTSKMVEPSSYSVKLDTAYVDKDNRIVFNDNILESKVKKILNKTPQSPVLLADVAHITALNISNQEKSQDDIKVRNIDALKYFKELEVLNADHNLITSLNPLISLKNLRIIRLSRSKVSDLSPISGLNNLEELNLYGNHVSDLAPISHLTKLKRLNLFCNMLKDISELSGLNNLTELNLGRNKITDISSLENKQFLKVLWLFENKVNNPEIISTLGSSLRELSLGACDISDISYLKDCRQLKYLVLFDNQISNIDALKELKSLNTLLIARNQLSNLNILVEMAKTNALSSPRKYNLVLDVSNNPINYSLNENLQARDTLKLMLKDSKF